MPIKKESSTSDKKGEGGIPGKYVQEQMKSGNPKPTADAPSKLRGSSKSSKKGSKK